MNEHDLDALFNDNDGLTKTVVFSTSSGDITINGLFENIFANPNLGETAYETTNNILTCKSSDIVDLGLEDLAKIEDEEYQIKSIQKNPMTGTSLIILV